MNIHHSTLAWALTLSAPMSVAYAGPCSLEIAQMQVVIESIVHKDAQTAPIASESIDAKMHRQPTDRSIADALVRLGIILPEQIEAVKTAIARAREADSADNRNVCEQALGDVRRLIRLP